MSETYIPAELRRLVVARAGHVCEYCLIAEADHPRSLQADHIRSEKHRGRTVAENLALACPECNQAKGSDPGSYDPETDQFTFFYNPRRDNWWEHFALVGARIEGRTDVGRTTALFLLFNDPERVQDREDLIAAGLYPGDEARRRMVAPA